MLSTSTPVGRVYSFELCERIRALGKRVVHLSLLYVISKRPAWGAFLAIAVTAAPSEGEEEDMDPTKVTLPEELRTPYSHTDDDNRGQVFTEGEVHAAIQAATMTTGELEEAIEKKLSPQPDEPDAADLSDDPFYRAVSEYEVYDERDRDGRLDTRARREAMGRYLPLPRDSSMGLQLPIGPARRAYDTRTLRCSRCAKVYPTFGPVRREPEVSPTGEEIGWTHYAIDPYWYSITPNGLEYRDGVSERDGCLKGTRCGCGGTLARPHQETWTLGDDQDAREFTASELLDIQAAMGFNGHQFQILLVHNGWEETEAAYVASGEAYADAVQPSTQDMIYEEENEWRARQKATDFTREETDRHYAEVRKRAEERRIARDRRANDLEASGNDLASEELEKLKELKARENDHAGLWAHLLPRPSSALGALAGYYDDLDNGRIPPLGDGGRIPPQDEESIDAQQEGADDDLPPIIYQEGDTSEDEPLPEEEDDDEGDLDGGDDPPRHPSDDETHAQPSHRPPASEVSRLSIDPSGTKQQTRKEHEGPDRPPPPHKDDG